MEYSNLRRNIICGLAAIGLALSSVTANAGGSGNGKGGHNSLYDPNTPSLSIINTISDVSGYVAGTTNTHFIYPISGEVYATMTNGLTGETLGSFREVGSISATALFGLEFGLLTSGDWGNLEETLPWTMSDDFSMVVSGTTFSLQEELTGRAFPHLGPVENPQETGTMALRMSGCAGLRADDQGEYAGKVGTLCLNGTFSFDAQFNGAGVSNCSIAIHDPLI